MEKVKKKDNFVNCQATCESEFSGNLVTIESAEEEKYIGYIINGPTWIGYHASNVNEDSIWDWTSDSTTRYENWNTGEPSYKCGPERCSALKF